MGYEKRADRFKRAKFKTGKTERNIRKQVDLFHAKGKYLNIPIASGNREVRDIISGDLLYSVSESEESAALSVGQSGQIKKLIKKGKFVEARAGLKAMVGKSEKRRASVLASPSQRMGTSVLRDVATSQPKYSIV